MNTTRTLKSMSISEFGKLFSRYFRVRVFNREIERWVLGYFPVVEFVTGLALIDKQFIHPVVREALNKFMPTEYWAACMLMGAVISYICRRWYIVYIMTVTLPLVIFGVQSTTSFITSSTHNIPLIGVFALLLGGGSLVFSTKIYQNGKE